GPDGYSRRGPYSAPSRRLAPVLVAREHPRAAERHRACGDPRAWGAAAARPRAARGQIGRRIASLRGARRERTGRLRHRPRVPRARAPEPDRGARRRWLEDLRPEWRGGAPRHEADHARVPNEGARDRSSDAT